MIVASSNSGLPQVTCYPSSTPPPPGPNGNCFYQEDPPGIPFDRKLPAGNSNYFYYRAWVWTPTLAKTTPACNQYLNGIINSSVATGMALDNSIRDNSGSFGGPQGTGVTLSDPYYLDYNLTGARERLVALYDTDDPNSHLPGLGIGQEINPDVTKLKPVNNAQPTIHHGGDVFNITAVPGYNGYHQITKVSNGRVYHVAIAQ